jgi:hypothetical protein
VITKTLEDFETVSLHVDFDDTAAGPCDLGIRIINLSKLPIRDDGNFFVSGMIQLQSIKLQGIEIAHMLDNTMFGNDAELTLPLEIPVYPWMVQNYSKILLKEFNFPIIDI